MIFWPGFEIKKPRNIVFKLNRKIKMPRNSKIAQKNHKIKIPENFLPLNICFARIFHEKFSASSQKEFLKSTYVSVLSERIGDLTF